MLPAQFATALLNIEGIEYDHHTRYYLVDDDLITVDRITFMILDITMMMMMMMMMMILL